jgi:hypothetical protein
MLKNEVVVDTIKIQETFRYKRQYFLQILHGKFSGLLCSEQPL